MHFSFQFLDIAVVAIVVVSAIYGTYRGFVSESLAIFGWIAAAYATLFFGPWVAWWMRDVMSPEWIGEVIGYLVVFLVVLIPMHFASSRIAQNVKKTQVGTLDSVLGTGFGVLRGAAIIGIAYILFIGWMPGRQPGWIADSQLYPVIRACAQMVASVIPDQDVQVPDARRSAPVSDDPIVQKLEESSADAPKRDAEPAPKAADPEPVNRDKPKATKQTQKTYGAKDRHALDRLIETTNSDANGKR